MTWDREDFCTYRKKNEGDRRAKGLVGWMAGCWEWNDMTTNRSFIDIEKERGRVTGENGTTEREQEAVWVSTCPK